MTDTQLIGWQELIGMSNEWVLSYNLHFTIVKRFQFYFYTTVSVIRNWFCRTVTSVLPLVLIYMLVCAWCIDCYGPNHRKLNSSWPIQGKVAGYLLHIVSTSLLFLFYIYIFFISSYTCIVRKNLYTSVIVL